MVCPPEIFFGLTWWQLAALYSQYRVTAETRTASAV